MPERSKFVAFARGVWLALIFGALFNGVLITVAPEYAGFLATLAALDLLFAKLLHEQAWPRSGQ